MVLSHFNSYFEILVGLNLGYATFKYFRDSLNNKFIYSKYWTLRLLKLQSRLEVYIVSEGSDSEKIIYQDINGLLDLEKEALESREERMRNFFEILKPISFILSLLCLSFLILSGFQGALEDEGFFNRYFVLLSLLVSIFCFIMFYFSFSTRVIENEIRIKWTEMIVVFFLLVVISYLLSANHLFIVPKKYCLLTIASAPTIFYLLFTIRTFLKCKQYEKRKSLDIIKSFFKYLKSNFVNVIPLIILYIASVVCLSFFYKDSFSLFGVFAEYIIVLITPLLLYLFIAIRVLLHNIYYSKKFQDLAKRHEIALDVYLTKKEKDNPLKPNF